MTNEQYTNIMIEFERLHARIDELEKSVASPVYNVTVDHRNSEQSRLQEILDEDKTEKPTQALLDLMSGKCGGWERAKLGEGNFDGPQPVSVVSSRCLWDNLSPEDRMKPMGLSCPCNKCSTYC